MKVIITSGGTREHIDNVRTISNTSSGRLGQCMAESFLEKGFEVIYIHGSHALLPQGHAQCVEIESASDLESAMQTYLEDTEVCAVVHAMAVSDYSVLSAASFEMLASALEHKSKAEIEGLLKQGAIGYDRSHKIGSSEEGLAVMMKQAPKIISLIKKQRPDVVLVGFKLLVDVTKEELIKVGHALLKKNDCTFVLANDSKLIRNDNHVGHLVDARGSYTTYTTKQEIASGIVEHVMKEVNAV